MKQYRITVFTPTYNRGYIIEKLFQSLQKQSFKDFEWLVVDDGSTDNTEDLFENFLKISNFKITYLKKENGGQHTALNLAIPLAKGELFMIVDSDDYLREDALEMIDYYENSIRDKNLYAGVSGLRCNHIGDTIGDKWRHRSDYIDATNFERKSNGLLGDKAEAYYTTILKKFYPLPQFEGENDVEKGVLWNRIADSGLKIRWFKENIYFCEYLEDGMTRNITNNYIRNFQGYTIFIKETMAYKKIPIITKLKMIIMYCYISKIKKISIKQISSNLSLNRYVIPIPYFIGSCLYMYKYKKFNN